LSSGAQFIKQNSIPELEGPGTDVMILKIFSPKKSEKKIGVFD
jgi:hypothetical protein